MVKVVALVFLFSSNLAAATFVSCAGAVRVQDVQAPIFRTLISPPPNPLQTTQSLSLPEAWPDSPCALSNHEA